MAEETPSAAPEVDDHRADVEAAFDQVEGTSDVSDQPPAAPEPDRSPATPAPDEIPARAVAPERQARAPTTHQDRAAQAAAAQRPTIAAPRTWRAEAREHWSKVPQQVQSEVIRREQAVQTALQESADAREFKARFEKVSSPYRWLIDQDGMDEMQAYESYLKGVTHLRTGTAHEKAVTFASLIGSFGIDLNLLDSAIAAAMQSGRLPPNAFQQQPSGNGQHPQQQAQFRDPRLDTLLAELETHKNQTQQQLAGEVADELVAFEDDPANEFYHDVREDMADIIEMATRRGQKITLADAYKKACKSNDDVGKVMSQREVSKAAATMASAAHRARRASLSVSGTPTVPDGVPASDGTRRGDIEAAIAQLSGR